MTLIFFVSLIAILVFGAAKMWIYAGVALVALIVILVIGYKKPELKDWINFSDEIN